MAQETTTSEQEVETIRADMEETRTNLTDKVHTLEHEIKNDWTDATSTLAGTVESIKATIQTVREAVHDSGEALGRAFDVPAHLRRHPWVMIAAAVLLGLVAGKLAYRR